MMRFCTESSFTYSCSVVIMNSNFPMSILHLYIALDLMCGLCSCARTPQSHILCAFQEEDLVFADFGNKDCLYRIM